MTQLVRSKVFISFVIAAFILFITPSTLKSEIAGNTGNLIGFIYAEDGTTPVEGAVFKVKNVKTNKVYESTQTDELGVFKIEGIEEGLYLAGVNSEDKAYVIENVLAFQGDTTAKLSLSLKSGTTVALAQGDDDDDNGFAFLGLHGAAAIAALAAILAGVGVGIAALLGAFEDEASPFKK